MDKRTERHAAMILAGLCANPHVITSADVSKVVAGTREKDELVEFSFALAERLENYRNVKGEQG